MASEDGPPPLEDMTATLEQAKKIRQLKLGVQGSPTGTCSSSGPKTVKNATSQQPSSTAPVPAPHSQTQTNTAPAPVPQTNTAPAPVPQTNTAPAPVPQTNTAPKPAGAPSAKAAPSKKSGSGDFGGMKKGFLFGGSKPSSAASGKQGANTKPGSQRTDSGKGDPHAQAESIPFIKPQTDDKNAGLKLDEVQTAMESTKGFLQDKEWVTDDLLERVQKSETLGKRLGDPRFMQAVMELQTDPKAAMTKYQGNAEMQQFLKEFCGILGEHFSSLGEKEDSQTPQQAPTSTNATHTGPKITEITDDDDALSSATSPESSVPVDPHVQQILADPANREILMDPKVQELIQHLRSDPEKAQRLLREGDSTFRQKVDHLISLGLLKFQA